MRGRALAVMSLLLLAACATTPPPAMPSPPLGTLTDRSIEEAEAAIALRLEALGFALQPDRQAGSIWGEIESGAPAEWFICDRIIVLDRTSDHNQRQWADPEDLKARVGVTVSRLGTRTSVSIAPRFTGIYRDRFVNQTFERACATAGILEPAVLGAAGGR